MLMMKVGVQRGRARVVRRYGQVAAYQFEKAAPAGDEDRVRVSPDGKIIRQGKGPRLDMRPVKGAKTWNSSD